MSAKRFSTLDLLRFLDGTHLQWGYGYGAGRKEGWFRPQGDPAYTSQRQLDTLVSRGLLDVYTVGRNERHWYVTVGGRLYIKRWGVEKRIFNGERKNAKQVQEAGQDHAGSSPQP